MFSLLTAALKFLFRNKSWLVRVTSGLITAYVLGYACFRFSVWLLGHTADVFTGSISLMDTLSNEISQYVANTGVEWIDFILSSLELDFFLQKLIGWLAFMYSVIQWTLLGGVPLVVGWAIKGIIQKWTMRQYEIASQSMSSL